jgi:uncharacterized protein YndB with AHSA1/START domain
MTIAHPGDPFRLDLDGTVIDGRYLEVDPPHRLVMGWDRLGTDEATPTSALAEITFTPAAGGTRVTVELSGLSGDDADLHRGLWTRHFARIADALAGTGPGGIE